MATSHQGSENAFAKVLESAESAKATLQAFKAMETFFGGSLLSKESFLVTKKLFELKAYKQVIEFASRAIYAYLTKNDDPTRLLCANVLCLMAGSSFNLGEYDESLLYLNRAKAKLNQLLDDNNASAVEILLDIQTNMTTVKDAIGNTDEAVVHALNILEIKGNTLEEGCVELGDANMTVSDAYLRASDHKSALLYCKKALEIYEKHLGKMHCLVGFTYSILGAAYSKSDQKEQSVESLEKAKKILDVTLGRHNLSSLQTSHRLSLVYAALERYDEAIGIEEKVVEGLQGMASSEQIFLEEAVKHLSDMKKGRDTESSTNASPSQSIDDANLAAKISKVGISDE